MEKNRVRERYFLVLRDTPEILNYSRHCTYTCEAESTSENEEELREHAADAQSKQPVYLPRR